MANIDRGSIIYVRVKLTKSSVGKKTENRIRARIYSEAFVAVAARSIETA